VGTLPLVIQSIIQFPADYKPDYSFRLDMSSGERCDL
jgi:hypothetical protein